MEPEQKKIKPIETMPDATSEEKVFYWARQGRKRRLKEKIEYEREHYDRLAIYGNVLD